MGIKCFDSLSTQIILLITLPSIIMILICIGGIFVTLQQGQSIVSDYANYIYQKQIDNTKRHNGALIFQLSSQFQKMSWQINLLNSFQNKLITNKVKQNPYYEYKNNLHNIDRSYHDDEEESVLNLFRKNKLATSVWHHPGKSYLDQLDDESMQQIETSTGMDSIWRGIMYDNSIQDITNRKLKIRDIYIAFEHDGMVYMTSTNTTYENLEMPPDCPKQKFIFDIRCRYYYKDTKKSISLRMFEPNLFYTDGNPFVSSVLCQRLLKDDTRFGQQQKKLYSVICNNLDLSELPKYFQNFNKDSSIQVVIDPISLKLGRQQINTLKDLKLIQPTQSTEQKQNSEQQNENDKQIDEQEQNRLIQYIQQNYAKWKLQSTDSINLIQMKDEQKYLNTFEYNVSSGDDYFVIMNSVQIIDKIPKAEAQDNNTKKYDINNAMIFLDVLSKQVLTRDMIKLKDDVKVMFAYFVVISVLVFICILIFTIFRAVIISLSLIRGLDHLTRVLSKIKWETGEQGELQFADLLEENVKTESLFLSKDMKILYESFQNLFKTLHYTTSNIYSEDNSTNLLNLNIQTKYFKQFQNFRALGVCNNNMGNIHSNAERYFEAMECYQKAILYSHYDLGSYKEKNYPLEYNAYSRFSLPERSLYCRDPSTSKYECKSDKSDRSEREIHSWNLFNRKLNYFKAFIAYLNNQQVDNLWSCGEDLIDELLYISKTTLFKCYSRNIILLYYKSTTLFQQGKIQEYEQNLQKAACKFSKYVNLKNKIMNSVVYQPSLILNSFPSRIQFGQQNNKFKSTPKQNIFNQIYPNQLHLMNPNYQKNQSPSINLQSGIRFSTKDKACSNFSNSRQPQNSINNDNIPKTLIDIPQMYNSKAVQEFPFNNSNRENHTPSPQQKTFANNSLGYEFKNKYKQNSTSQQKRESSQYQNSKQQQIRQTLPSSLNNIKKQKSKQEISSKQDVFNSQVYGQEGQIENEITNLDKQMANNDHTPVISLLNLQIVTHQNLNEFEKKTPQSNLQLLDTQEYQPSQKSKQFLTQDQNNLSSIRRSGSILQTNQNESTQQTNQKNIIVFDKDEIPYLTQNTLNKNSVSQNEIRKRESSLMRGYKIFTKAFFSSSPQKSKKQKRPLQPSRSETKIKSVSEFGREKNNSIFSKMNFKISLQKLKQFFKKAKEEQLDDENNANNNNNINSNNNNNNSVSNININNNIMQDTNKNQNNRQNKRDSNKYTQYTNEYQQQNQSLIYQNERLNNSRKTIKRLPSTFNLDKQSSKTNNIGQYRYGDLQNQSIQSIDKNIFQGLQFEQPQVSKVKKYLNDEQISRQILPPDVLQSFVIIQQAELLILKKEYYLACQILTNELLDQKICLQHIRFRILRLLKKIFREVSLFSPDIDQMLNSLQQTSIFKIQFVSCCTLSSSLNRSYELLVDVKDELIKKDKDHLGLIVYNKDDQLFSQEIFMMPYQQLKKASLEGIEYLLKSIYREFSQIQQQQMIKTQNEQNDLQQQNSKLQIDEEGQKTKQDAFQEHDDSMFEYQDENSFNEQQRFPNTYNKNQNENVKNKINQNINNKTNISTNQNDNYNNNSLSNQNQQSIISKNIMTEQTISGISPFSKKLLGDNRSMLYNNFNNQFNQYSQKQRSFMNVQNESSLYQFESMRINQLACDNGIDQLDGISTLQTPNDKMKSSTANLQIKKKPYVFNTSEINLSVGQLKEDNSRSPFTNINKRHFFQDYEDVEQKYDNKNFNKFDSQYDQKIKSNIIAINSFQEINDQSNTNSNNIFQQQANSNEETSNNQLQSYSSRRIQLEFGSSQYPSPQSKTQDDLCLIQNKKSIFKSSVDISIEKRDLFNSNLGSMIDNNLLITPFETPLVQKNQKVKDKFTFVNNLQNEDFISPGPSQKEISNLIVFNERSEKSENDISFGSENCTPISRRQSSERHQNPKSSKINLKSVNDFNGSNKIDDKNIPQKTLFTKILNENQQIKLNIEQTNDIKERQNFESSIFHEKKELTIDLKKIGSKRNSSSTSPNTNNKEEINQDGINRKAEYDKKVENSPNRNRMYSFQVIKKVSDHIDPNDKDLIMNSQNEQNKSPAFLPLQGLKINDQTQNFEVNQDQLNNSSSIKDTDDSSIQIIEQKLDKDRNQIFHLGVQKALSGLLLPNEESQTYSYISQIYKNNQNSNLQEAGQLSSQSSKHNVYKQEEMLSVQKYIIFVTDQIGVSQDNILYKQLCNMLRNTDIVLLVLQLNSLAQTEESSTSEEVYENEKCVIKYFYSQTKLLQYIYSQRQSFNVNLHPLIIEHFQTNFLFVFIF